MIIIIHIILFAGLTPAPPPELRPVTDFVWGGGGEVPKLVRKTEVGQMVHTRCYFHGYKLASCSLRSDRDVKNALPCIRVVSTAVRG
jgi:hypothetical protein